MNASPATETHAPADREPVALSTPRLRRGRHASQEVGTLPAETLTRPHVFRVMFRIAQIDAILLGF